MYLASARPPRQISFVVRSSDEIFLTALSLKGITKARRALPVVPNGAVHQQKARRARDQGRSFHD